MPIDVSRCIGGHLAIFLQYLIDGHEMLAGPASPNFDRCFFAGSA